MSYACFDKMSSCPHMDRPYGQSTAFGLFCLLWHQLATTNQHIYFMYFPYSRNSTPQFLSQFISGNFRNFCVRSCSIACTFFSGTKPPIASSDSGAFPENSLQSRAGQGRARRVGESSGQGCRRTLCTRGRATGGVLVGKSARPPLKRGLPAAAALPWTLLRHVFHRCVVSPACLLSARLDLRMQPFESFPEGPDNSTSCALFQCSFSTIPRDQCQL